MIDTNLSNKENLIKMMLLAKNGNTDAFSILYEELFTPVFRYFFRRTSDQGLSEDLAQSVFTKSFESIKRFSNQDKHPLTYFFTISRNVFSDFIKKNKLVFVEKDLLEESIDSNEDTKSDLYQKDLQNELTVALQSLPFNQAEAIRLSFIEDLDNKTISEILGINEANLRKIKQRALEKLRKKVYLKIHLP